MNCDALFPRINDTLGKSLSLAVMRRLVTPSIYETYEGDLSTYATIKFNKIRPGFGRSGTNDRW